MEDNFLKKLNNKKAFINLKIEKIESIIAFISASAS